MNQHIKSGQPKIYWTKDRSQTQICQDFTFIGVQGQGQSDFTWGYDTCPWSVSSNEYYDIQNWIQNLKTIVKLGRILKKVNILFCSSTVNF